MREPLVVKIAKQLHWIYCRIAKLYLINILFFVFIWTLLPFQSSEDIIIFNVLLIIVFVYYLFRDVCVQFNVAKQINWVLIFFINLIIEERFADLIELYLFKRDFSHGFVSQLMVVCQCFFVKEIIVNRQLITESIEHLNISFLNNDLIFGEKLFQDKIIKLLDEFYLESQIAFYLSNFILEDCAK